MPKLKTHRSAAKRYKVRKRRIFKMVGVSESHVALVSKELPYKKYSR